MIQIWHDCSRLLERELTPQQYVAWIKPLRAIAYDPDGHQLRLGAPNRLKLDAVRCQFAATPRAVWSSLEGDATQSVAWGDYDGDGDLDLAAGNGTFNQGEPNRVYRNDNGVLTPSAVWSSTESDYTESVTWGDVDGDGDLDLAAANFQQPSRVYRNGRASAIRPLNNLPRVAVIRPDSHSANFLSAGKIITTSIIPITYTLSDKDGEAGRFIRAYYSPNGGGQWYTATATSGTVTTNLTATISGTTRTFNWDERFELTMS